MALWADYSGGRPSGAALKAAGFSGVIRYVGLGSAGKRITAAEYRDLTAAGVQVLLVAERDTTDAWNGYATGTANARAALNDARALGIPDSVGIAAAADAHAVNSGQIAAAVQYARGFQDVLGKARTGFYGFVEVLNAVHAAGVGSWYWRCGSYPDAAARAWVHFWQRNAGQTTMQVSGVTCDINDQLNPLPTQGDDVNLSDRIPVTNGTTHLPDATVGDALGRILFELTYPIESRATINRDPKNLDTLLGRATSADGNAWDNGRRLNALAAKVDALATTPAPVALSPADLDALAAKVAATVSSDAIAAKVADLLAARLTN